MNPTRFFILAIAIGVVITAYIIWKLQKFRETDTYQKSQRGIIKVLKWEERMVLKFQTSLLGLFSNKKDPGRLDRMLKYPKSIALKIQKKIGELLEASGIKDRSLLSLNPDKQYRLFFTSIILIVLGQYIMGRSDPIDSWEPVIETINDWLRVDAKYLGSVMLGMACTLIGGILFAVSTYKSDIFKKDHFNPFPEPADSILQKFYFSKWGMSLITGCLLFALLIYRSSKLELEFYDSILWIFSIGFISNAIYQYNKAAGLSIKPTHYFKDLGIITLLLILGLLIGTYQLQDIPNSFLGDEGNFFETARSIAQGEYKQSIIGFGVYSYPILSSFIQAGIIKVFGADLWGWRFASVLPAMLTIIPLYLIGRDLFNRWVGIIASLAFISSPYLLSFARLGYNNSQTIFLVTLCIWFFYQGLQKKNLFFIYLGGITAGFGFLTYTSGRLGLVILFTLFVYTYLSTIRYKKGKRFLLAAVLLFMLGWAIIATPHLVYGNNQDPETLRYKMVEGLLFQKDYAAGLLGEEAITETSALLYLDRYQVFYNLEMYGRLLLRGFVRSILGFQIDDFSSNHYLSSALAGPIAVIFYICGVYAILAHFWRKNSFPILFWFASGLLFLSIISTYPPRPAHLVVVIPALELMIGIGVYISINQITAYLRYKNWDWAPLRSILVLIICAAIMIAGITEYYINSPKFYRPDLEQVMNWAGLHNPRETKFIYINDDPERDTWLPYFYHLGLTAPQFDTVNSNEVLRGIVQWPVSQNYSIFIEEPQAETLTPIILREIGQAKYKTFTNRDGNPIGRAIVKGSVTFSSSVPFLTGLVSLLKSKVMWLILPLAGLELYLLFKLFPKLGLSNLLTGSVKVKTRSSDVPLVSRPRKSSIQNSVTNQKTQTEIPPEASNSFEFGFFFDLALQKVNHYFQAKIVFNHQKNDNHLPPQDGKK